MCGLHYHSEKVKCRSWYPTRGTAIAAFKRACKEAGIAPPERHRPSGDTITHNDLAYPRRIWAAGMREGHGWVYVDPRNDLLPR
ncbi:MAG TPA: hypothetical protein VF783_06900 [Terriglobales bacterium]